MNANKKILTVIVLMMSILVFVSIGVFIYNFKDFSVKITSQKAISIAQNVRDGLTSHMVNGTMDKRKFFLDNIARDQKLENFHLLRTKTVVDQYGKGIYGEAVANELEKKVLKTNQVQVKLVENLEKVYLKISIPYIASSNSSPNCMQCHNAKEGEVLGVISMDIDYTATRLDGIYMASKIFVTLIIVLIIAILIINYYIKPYIKLFDDLENGISHIYNGNYSFKIDTTLTDEAGLVARRLNELSEIYKFKNTIELDDNKMVIYDRIVHVLTNKFKIEHFILYEFDNTSKRRITLYNTTKSCVDDFHSNLNKCRAFRTLKDVVSTDFDNICVGCDQKTSEYLCLSYPIDDNYSIVLHIQTNDIEELYRIESFKSIIKNYFNMSKPVLETKVLLNKLRETTLKDPMTELYNRRFLDELFDSQIASRTKDGYCHAIMMLDVDFFKQVNDTYGHDVGDKVLKKLSTLMRGAIRNSDVAVRFGGEEFLILLMNTTKEKTIQIAQNINKQFSQELFQSNIGSFKKTISIGISYYPDHSKSLWKSLKYADEALYIAKNTGRNKVIEFTQNMHKDGKNF